MLAQVFAKALSAISEGVLIAGPDRRMIYANKAFTSITGFTEQDMLGQSCACLQGSDTAPASILAIRNALETEQNFSGEILNYRKSGESFWNELTISPAYGPDGVLQYFIGVIRDVTTRRSTERELLSLDRQFRFLFDHVQAGIVLHDADTSVLEANAMAATLLGHSEEDILGAVDTDPRWIFVREDGSPMPVEEYPVNRAIETGAIVRNLIVGNKRVRDGKLLWLTCTAYPVYDKQGALARIVVSFTDVTELKQAEHALQKSEERLRLVLRGANDAAWDVDFQTSEAYYSPRWWQMLGYEEDELPADTRLWTRVLHPADKHRVEEFFDRTIVNSDRSTYSLEFRFRHKKGRSIPVLSRGFVLRDSVGKPLRVSGTDTDLTEQKRIEKKIHKLAFYDTLTGLPNRQLLVELLREALKPSPRASSRGAILFIDIDDFKTLNDTLGHESGDMLLQQVAKRLRKSVRRKDIIARLGNDEFIVVLDQLPTHIVDTASYAKGIAHRIRELVGLPYTLATFMYRCSFSIGIAPFEGGNWDAETLLKQADLAVHHAKTIGRNSTRFFDQTMQASADRRLELELDLRSGIQERQMVLFFQLQVDHSGAITGAETLIRWNHPTRGLLTPDAFIPLAEATGLIVPLGEWVLQTVCEQLTAWSSHPRLSKINLSVNLSVRQIHEALFTSSVIDALTISNADPARLKLEITESLLASDTEDVIQKMTSLRKRGVSFSIDDFGTGYSSLQYLQRMPLDELKIDRAFVREMLETGNAAAITRIVIALAQNLGLSVIAEGVETEEQRQFLHAHGCDRYQGYLFGKPVALAEFEAKVLASSL